MGVDLAKLVIAVDASQVTPAASKLDTLTAAGARAEASTGKLKTATSALSQEQLALKDKTLSAASASDLLAKRADKLLSQMDPMYKAQRAYQAQLAEIAVLNNAGAISETERATLTIAAEKAIAEATAKSAAVQVAAHGAVAGSSLKIRESLVALRELSVGNYTRLAGSASILAAAFGLVNSVLLPAIAIGAALGAVFLVATQQINKGSGDLTKGLGLTADQLDRVKQRTVTFGDTVKATFQVLIKDTVDLWGQKNIDAVVGAFNYIVKFVAGSIATIIGVVVGAVRAIEEAWQSLPTWLGGNNKSFSFGDVGKAFTSGVTDARKSVLNFYSDVADQARKNRIAEILKEAGKPGRAPGQGEIDRAAKQLTETQNQTASQTALNKAVEAGTITVAQANEQSKIDAQLKSVVADRDNASGALKVKLTAIINKLIPATKALNAANAERDLLKENDKQQKANDLLEAEIRLAGKSAEQRAVQIAQLKTLQELERRHVSPNSVAGKTALSLSARGASDTYTLGLVNSIANDNDIGTQIGVDAANTIRANDPNAAYKQQQSAYAAIDKLRKADVLSEKEAMRAKALADNEYNRQRLQGVSNMFGALASLQDSSNKELAAIGKAAAITQATIDGVLAVQKALASAPPPINYINAAAVGIAAAVNVAKIAGLRDGGLVQGPGGPRDDKVLLWGSNGEFMVNAAATARNRPLLEAMNNGVDVSRSSMPTRANGGYIGPTGGASNSNFRVVIEDHGTPKTYKEVPGITPDEVRLIADDRISKKVPDLMAHETAKPNSKFRRALGQHTHTQNKMSA